MSTFSKLVVIDGLIYQEIRDYNGKLLFCRRFIEDQHPPEYRGLDKAQDEWTVRVEEFKNLKKQVDDGFRDSAQRHRAEEERKGRDWEIRVKELNKDESVSHDPFKVKERPLPIKPYWVMPVKRVEEVDFSEDDEYYFSYLRYAGTVEFIYGKMSKFINTLTDEWALVPGTSPKSPGADYGLSQDAQDKLRWKEFITDNMFSRISRLSGGTNPLYEHRPLTWKEIENMEDTITKKEKYNEKS